MRTCVSEARNSIARTVTTVKKARQIASTLTTLSRLQVLCAIESEPKNLTKSNYLHAYNSSPNLTAIKNLSPIPAHKNPPIHHSQMWSELLHNVDRPQKQEHSRSPPVLPHYPLFSATPPKSQKLLNPSAPRPSLKQY